MKTGMCTVLTTVIGGWAALAGAHEIQGLAEPAILQGIKVMTIADAKLDEIWGGWSWGSRHQAGVRSVQQNGPRIRNTAQSRSLAFNIASGGTFAKSYAGMAATVTGQPWVAAPAYVVGNKAPEATIGVGMSAYYYGRGFVRSR